VLAALAWLFGYIFIFGALAGIWLAGTWRRWRWLWPFVRQVRRFRSAVDGPIVLHYAPELVGKWDFSALLQRCRTELDKLTKQFGSPLRGRVKVFLFASYQDYGKVFGLLSGGTALEHANAIVIVSDRDVNVSIRHELAHLFSGRWSSWAPPLLSEGLAVWWQDTWWGQSIDSAARQFLDYKNLKLSELLNREFFFFGSQSDSCYALAGSFTGFLIRRYGWDRYRTLYCLGNWIHIREALRCWDGVYFCRVFQECIGVGLEEAESQWRHEVLGSEIETEMYADELLHGLDEMLAASRPPFDLSHLRGTNRSVVWRLLEKLEASEERKYIPLLLAWQQVDCKKVRQKIRQVMQRLKDAAA
jgi:hypothetical protein